MIAAAARLLFCAAGQVNRSYLASMYRVELHNTVDEPWTAMEAIRVGPVPTGAGTPGVYVTIERDGVPFARIDAWPVSAGPFTQTETWKTFVVVGWNDHAYVIDPLTRDVIGIECDGYFGHIYPVENLLLIADASRLVCLNDLGERVWEKASLGIDGVVVDQIRDGVIFGQGEWDPPGGWRPFCLSLASGEPAAR
jgi:hypothetical protein